MPAGGVATLMLDGGLVAHHQARRDPSPRADTRRDGERVLEDLHSLCRAAQTYTDQVGTAASITGLLEHAALVLTRCHVRGGRASGGPLRFLAEAGSTSAGARWRRDGR